MHITSHVTTQDPPNNIIKSRSLETLLSRRAEGYKNLHCFKKIPTLVAHSTTRFGSCH